MKTYNTYECFVIRQNIKLVNGLNQWFDVATFHNEGHAREALEKAKKKSPDVVLLRVVEEQLS